MINKPKVWVIDDDRSIRWVLERALHQDEFNVTCFADGTEILNILKREQPDVILTDIKMPGIDGLELLRQIGARYPKLPVLIMTAHSDLAAAVTSFKDGAFEYLPKPFDLDEMLAQIKRACQREQIKLNQIKPNPVLLNNDLIGSAPAMQEVFRAIGRLARAQVTVLINGESGTGKELVAQALHRYSPRQHQPLIALNTAAIPRDLLESELFGHERGSFTGAQTRHTGRFEQADQGTLFLDEIGDMPFELQTRLLRVLADGSFYRVGGSAPIQVDVRIIAATHQNLDDLVRQGRFREDLWHRLNVIRIQLPPLRERRSDIPLLMNHFLARAASELNCEPKILLPSANERLQNYAWPGNVRQLENVALWLTVMVSGSTIQAEDLPPELSDTASNLLNINLHSNQSESWEAALQSWVEQNLITHTSEHPALLHKALPTFERILIQTVLAHTSGRRQEAAKILGWGRNTLTRKLKELNI